VKHDRAVLAVSGALLTTIVLLASFVLVLARRQEPSQPAPAHLTWHQVVLPPGTQLNELQQPSSIAPSDGNTVFACALSHDAHGTTAQTWISHDRGTHWVRLADLPAAYETAQACWMTVDAIHPLVAVAVVASAPQLSFLRSGQATAYATSDGGHTWRVLADPESFQLGAFATLHGATYTLACCTPAADGRKGLVVSHDGMQTWQPIDTSIIRVKQHVTQFWLTPDTGELLAVGQKPQDDQRHLWSSSDAGKQWSELNTPYVNRFVVQQPSPGKPWQVCGIRYRPSNESHVSASLPEQVVCSHDDAHTWMQVPLLTSLPPVAQTPSALTTSTASAGWDIVAISEAGDLLAEDAGPSGRSLYRLIVGSTQWQSLGRLPLVPNAAVYYVASPGTGMLWVFPLSNKSTASEATAYTAIYP
jgi:photosystem II stability/assembly factor-like uncharacterized protein